MIAWQWLLPAFAGGLVLGLLVGAVVGLMFMASLVAGRWLEPPDA